MKKWLFLILLTGSLSLFLNSCTEEEIQDILTTLENLGWAGTDDMDTVESNVTQFGDTGNLPASVDLTPKFPPIGDQGNYGTCVAWATAYNHKTALNALEHGYSASQLSSPAYQSSPKDLYLAIPDQYKASNLCQGTDFGPALSVLRDRGAATMQTVPYTGLGNCSSANLQSSWTNEAAQNRLDYWRKVEPSTAADLKALLADNIPIIFGAKLSDNFMTWNSEAVLSSNTSYSNVGQHAYHAMVLAGYSDSKGAFKVINSWSRNWGANGYIWVDYDFFMNEFCRTSQGERPLFIAVNEGGTVTPPDDPDPVSQGVDLASWVFEDYADGFYQGYPQRVSNFNIYNIGNQTANASTRWAIYYIAFNAYDANDYGVLFSCTLDPGVPYGGENCTDFNTCYYNVNIPSGGDFAAAMGWQDFYFAYAMPLITGYYYLAIYADPIDEFTETNETNNIFYPFDQPVYFQNGQGVTGGDSDTRTAGQPGFAFKNDLQPTPVNLLRSPFNGGAVLQRHPNTYRQAEIAAVLRASKADGRLEQKLAEMKARNPQR